MAQRERAESSSPARSRPCATRTRASPADIAALRTDPAAIERIAREELGLARPGETVFLIREPSPASPADRAHVTLDTRLDMAGRMTALFENVPKPRSLIALMEEVSRWESR